MTPTDLQAYCDYYGISAKEFQAGYHDGDYEVDPPEISWEEFCLFNGKEAYDDDTSF